MFALDRIGMLKVGGCIVLAYVLLVAALFTWAPQRIDLRIEAVIVFAYASVLFNVAYLGSFIAGLRASLRERNRSLRDAMGQLEDLATRDPLTRLPNRRSILEHLTRESSRIERPSPDENLLGVSIVDVDYFKRINDNHGHYTGDAVLCRIGEALQSAIREADFVGRYGGEEFLVLFPQTNVEGALAAAERLRATVEELEICELPAQQRVTVSQGLALHRSGDDIDATLKRADDALYRAKDGGRNRVFLAVD